MDYYAVFGAPIAHSLSPACHQAFAQQTQQNMAYHAQLVQPNEFIEKVQAFQQQGGKGLNITVPLKTAAYHFAQAHSGRAQRAKAVNTLIFNEKDCMGDNTDGVGLVRDLSQNLRYALRDKHILLLGAGGAVRGVLAPLLAEKPARITLANRTPSKAVDLAQDFSDLAPIHACGFADLAGQGFDLMINGTATSLSGDVPPLPDNLARADALAYDMAYNRQHDTAFVAWAKQHRFQAVDGLGMLVEQAAESFFLWRGVRPQTQPVLRQLRGQA